jgi:small subunit ribosomal protein S27Ae
MAEKWKLYETKDDKLERTHQFCPRCGEGIFMAEHKDRLACGACGYTVWKER